MLKGNSQCNRAENKNEDIVTRTGTYIDSTVYNRNKTAVQSRLRTGR